MGMGEVLRLVGSWMERQWRLLTFSILVLIYWTELKFMLLRVWGAEEAGGEGGEKTEGVGRSGQNQGYAGSRQKPALSTSEAKH